MAARCLQVKSMLKSFNRRKDGIIKKAGELSVLCGVQVGLIIFGHDKPTPCVFPGNVHNLHSIIESYFNTTKHKTFATKIGTKHSEDSLVDQIDGLSIEKLNELLGSLDLKLERVNSRIDIIKRAPQNPPLYVAHPETAVPLTFQYPNPIPDNLDAKLERVNSGIDIMHQNPPLDLRNPENNVPHHQDIYFDTEDDSMLSNCTGGFNSVSGNSSNCDYGSQFYGSCPVSDGVPLFPVYAQENNYNSDYGSQVYGACDVSGNNYNFDIGYQVCGACGVLDMVQGNNFNFDYGSQVCRACGVSDIVPENNYNYNLDCGSQVYGACSVSDIVLGNNYNNFDCGSQVYGGACGVSNMPVLPVYAQGPINPNFISGNMSDLGAQMMATDARVQSANLSGFIQLENMLLQ